MARSTAAYLSLAVLVFQNSMLALMMRYSRTLGGDMYFASTAVVICEVLKFTVSLFLLMKEEAVPAALYTVQNNLAYFAMSNLDAATYQLLYQLKILTTALFSVFLLKKSLNFKQWISLCVLCFGVGLVQTSSILKTPTSLLLSSSSSQHTDGDNFEEMKEQQMINEKKNSLLGFLAVLAACCSSGLAGVYFEMVLKNAKTSLWIRNLQLSLFGMILGFIPVMNDWSVIMEQKDGFFHGYNWIVWMVILLQAGGGILVAIVVKYADNILKGFATSLSIIMSCIASYFLFNFKVNGIFAFGAFLILCAVYVYGNEANNTNNNNNNNNINNNNNNSVSNNNKMNNHLNLKMSPLLTTNKRSTDNIESGGNSPRRVEGKNPMKKLSKQLSD